tara:strand:+ start:205 stop:489 length:285 start_codon:yes stop_codon:yes gene_type:complete
MFEGLEQIAAPDDATGKDGLRRVGWAELAAAISLSRSMNRSEERLLAKVGPSFDYTDRKDECGVNPSYLASRKSPGDKDTLNRADVPTRHRENR